MPLVDEWWFSHRNVVAEATLDGGDEIVDFEPSNVIDVKGDNVWRNVLDDPMTLKGELPEPAPVQCAIIRIKPGDAFGDADEATIGFSDVDSDSNELGEWTIALDADPFTGCVVYLAETEISATYFNISIPNDPNKDIEYIHMGPLFLPALNFSRSPEVTPDDTTAIERSLFTSSKAIQEGPQTERFLSQFQVWELDEYRAWRLWTRERGLVRPFAFGHSQTTQLNESYIGHFVAPVRWQIVDDRWLGQLQIEALR